MRGDEINAPPSQDHTSSLQRFIDAQEPVYERALAAVNNAEAVFLSSASGNFEQRVYRIWADMPGCKRPR